MSGGREVTSTCPPRSPERSRLINPSLSKSFNTAVTAAMAKALLIVCSQISLDIHPGPALGAWTGFRGWLALAVQRGLRCAQSSHGRSARATIQHVELMEARAFG